MRQFLLITMMLMPFLSCGTEEEPADTGGGTQIIISEGMIFATPDITVPSGATITIINNDDSAHTITSESGEDAFDDTGDFDVLVAGDGMALLTLPAAPSGTVFFYYCRLFLEAMSPANGMITIE